MVKNSKSPKHKIIYGDTLQSLTKLESNIFDLIITSPSYNIGKNYETKQSIENYP